MSRYTVYEDEDFLLELEETPQGPFIHCTDYNWSKSVYRKMQRVFSMMSSNLRSYGFVAVFAMIPKEDEKNKKFANIFGFVYLSDSPLESSRGEEEIYIALLEE